MRNAKHHDSEEPNSYRIALKKCFETIENMSDLLLLFFFTASAAAAAAASATAALKDQSALKLCIVQFKISEKGISC